MYCAKCGTQISPDGRFCMNCGEPVLNGSEGEGYNTNQNDQQQTDVSFGEYYAQPLTEDAPLHTKQTKNKKTMVLIIASVLLVCALAAALFLDVFATEKGWPLSGDTLQTRFVNDSIKVFDIAFGDINYGKTDEMKDQPFEMKMNLKFDNAIPGTVINADSVFEYAYDEKALGIKMTQEHNTFKYLLLKDVFYFESIGNYLDQVFSETVGIKFESDKDLSKPMGLEERMNALLFGDEPDLDFTKIFEHFFNSINKECFHKNDRYTTVKLNGSDLSQTLKTFSGKLRDDKELNESIKDLLEKLIGIRLDISSLIPMITYQLSEQDFELIWTVRYSNANLPEQVEISFFEKGKSVFDFAFNAQRKENHRSMAFDFLIPDKFKDVLLTIEMQIDIQPDEIEYGGSIILNDTTMEFEHLERWDGYSFHGNAKISSSDQLDVMGFSYSGDLTIGAPSIAVKDDERFSVNTKDAKILDLNDLGSLFSSTGLFPEYSYET